MTKNYYLYYLELDNSRRYVGKTFQLSERLYNHIQGNRKSSQRLKESTVVSILDIIKITGAERNQESITARVENYFTLQEIIKNPQLKIRGGHYLAEWDTEEYLDKVKKMKSSEKYLDGVEFKNLCSESVLTEEIKEGFVKLLSSRKVFSRSSMKKLLSEIE